MIRKDKKDEMLKMNSTSKLVLKKLSLRELANVTGGAEPCPCISHHC